MTRYIVSKEGLSKGYFCTLDTTLNEKMHICKSKAFCLEMAAEYNTNGRQERNLNTGDWQTVGTHRLCWDGTPVTA